MGYYRRCELGQLHPGRRRHQHLSAGHGDLRDEHGTGKTVSEVAPNVVTGPLLTGLTAETDDSRATARGLYPAFDPQTLHYGIGCNATDTLV